MVNERSGEAVLCCLLFFKSLYLRNGGASAVKANALFALEGKMKKYKKRIVPDYENKYTDTVPEYYGVFTEREDRQMSIKDSIVKYIRDGESVSQGLGLEIEHFVVNDAGVQIEFHEVSSIIEKMAGILNAKIIYMDGYPVGYLAEDYSITLEPACQFEISINPYSDIETIKSVYEDFVTLWTPVLKARGYHLET